MTTRSSTVEPCECASIYHCGEALGGEQGLTAEELELSSLRAEIVRLHAKLESLRLELSALNRPAAERRSPISLPAPASVSPVVLYQQKAR